MGHRLTGTRMSRPASPRPCAAAIRAAVPREARRAGRPSTKPSTAGVIMDRLQLPTEAQVYINALDFVRHHPNENELQADDENEDEEQKPIRSQRMLQHHARRYDPGQPTGSNHDAEAAERHQRKNSRRS